MDLTLRKRLVFGLVSGRNHVDDVVQASRANGGQQPVLVAYQKGLLVLDRASVARQPQRTEVVKVANVIVRHHRRAIGEVALRLL